MEDNILGYIYPESLIMIPVLYIVLLFLRQTPRIPVWIHPWLVLLIGVVFSLLYYGLDITSVVQGILVAGASILVKDLVHKTMAQSETKKEDDSH